MSSTIKPPLQPWDVELIRRQGPGTLVQIGREGRLRRQVPTGSARVHLTWVDEAALALVEAAVNIRRNLALVYPAPAGDIAVLLAAEILLHRFLQGASSPAVGIVTADPARAARTWTQLAIAAPASCEALFNVFPCWRAQPDGSSPFGSRRVQGVLIGSYCRRWPVDVTIYDHLVGPAAGETAGPVVHIFADPMNPLLNELASRGELIWGWSDTILSLWHKDLDHQQDATVPFSIAQERIDTMASGVDISIVACRHEEAERAFECLRDDLRTLFSNVGPNPSRNLVIGLKVAWNYASTLAALPCRPSQHDRFAGLPPRAARSTESFEHEIMAWSRTMDGDLAEYAAVVATDMADLRASLDRGTPFVAAIRRYAQESTPTLVIVRTETAAKALIIALMHSEVLDARLAGALSVLKSRDSPLGQVVDAAEEILGTKDRDTNSYRYGNITVTWLRSLRRFGAVPRAVVVGAPPNWAWHYLDSGISRHLDLLVLGEKEAHRAQWALATVRAARANWVP